MSSHPLLKVRLHALAFGGDAVGKTEEGMTVFVPFGAPGEEVEVEVTERHKNFLRGRCVRVIVPSPHRIAPPCPYFGHCGGCQLQHLDYAAQLQQKKRFVEDALTRIGKLPHVKVREVIGMSNPWAYRHKATFVFSSVRSSAIHCASSHPTRNELRYYEQNSGGFFAAGSHQVVDVAECLIQHPVNNQILAAVKALVRDRLLTVFNPRTGRGVLRWLEARVNSAGAQAVATFVTTAQAWEAEAECVERLRAQVPQVAGVLRRIARRHDLPTEEAHEAARVISGQPYLHEELMGLRWRVHAGSFFQVNPQQVAILAEKVMEFADLRGGEIVVDAYCGVGFFTLLTARQGCTVYAIEGFPLAIADAAFNASMLPTASVHFLCDRVKSALPRLRAQSVCPDVVILDPPRSGAKEAIPEVVALQPRRIVYVSCDPATLARDLNALHGQGYEVKEVQPIDMFPQTFHVESVALLLRSN